MITSTKELEQARANREVLKLEKEQTLAKVRYLRDSISILDREITEYEKNLQKIQKKVSNKT